MTLDHGYSVCVWGGGMYVVTFNTPKKLRSISFNSLDVYSGATMR